LETKVPKPSLESLGFSEIQLCTHLFSLIKKVTGRELPSPAGEISEQILEIRGDFPRFPKKKTFSKKFKENIQVSKGFSLRPPQLGLSRARKPNDFVDISLIPHDWGGVAELNLLYFLLRLTNDPAGRGAAKNFSPRKTDAGSRGLRRNRWCLWKVWVSILYPIFPKTQPVPPQTPGTRIRFPRADGKTREGD